MMQSLQRQMIETELADIVGREYVLTDEADRMIYGVDYFWLPRMLVDRGQIPPLPDMVVLPETVEQVAAIVRLANVYRIPLIPWGGGSGSQGGIMPVYGGVTLDLKRLNRIVNINVQAQTVIAQAGLNGYELECELNRNGLTLPHYPASVHSATLGGYLACRGSGVLSTKYGKAEDMVLSIQLVLPNGDIIRTLPVPNHAAGPGVLQLFIGAEGSYGIITEATMRLESLPQERRFRAFLFGTLSKGLEAGRRMMLERLQPTVIRLYDEPSTIKQVKRILGISVEEGAYMIIGFDGWREMVELQERRALAICQELGANDLGSGPGWEWWNQRYNFYFPPYGLDFPWMFGTMDTVCTFDNIENLYWTKKKTLEATYEAWKLQYIAHFSHWYPWGVMVYDRFIIEEPPQDPQKALALHNEIWNLAVRTSITCGGVLNEHHGVGLKLARLMREQHGSTFQVLEGLKCKLDPHNVLNPGKMGFGPTS
ncbi:MAG: FAD-binding oxidoreductase [Acidobacteria bacterium]|nr:FAD-binding oxidoreductase [Acidobacteriota bacterium]MCI0723905.1 FAD-binding oxidoreductase [Acidobacteriota bacterium]